MKYLLAISLLPAFLLTACSGGSTSGPSLPSTYSSPSPPAPLFYPLTGLPAPRPEAVKRRPILVKLGNTPAERPQSGLGSADLIIEDVVEGGVTRLLAVYQSIEPQELGPVRSSREADAVWGSYLDGLLVHVGSSTEALRLLQLDKIPHLDETTTPAAFTRPVFRDPPYNAYTSIARIRSFMRSSSISDVAVPPALLFAKEVPPKGKPGSGVDIPFSNGYTSSYRYDAQLKKYARSVGGKPQHDATDGAALTFSNVVLLFTSYQNSTVSDADSAPLQEITLIGSGRLVLYRDGQRYEGVWSHTSLSDSFHFLTTEGNVLPFQVGKSIWEIVPKQLAPKP